MTELGGPGERINRKPDYYIRRIGLAAMAIFACAAVNGLMGTRIVKYSGDPALDTYGVDTNIGFAAGCTVHHKINRTYGDREGAPIGIVCAVAGKPEWTIVWGKTKLYDSYK